MSSTTSRHAQSGQALPIFAIGIFVLIGAVALAFDLGQVQLDRRAQQNAADAAALAGARYVVEPACFSSPSLGNCSSAVNEAMRVAFANGYGAGPTSASNGVVGPSGTTVNVYIPVSSNSTYYVATGTPNRGYIEVDIKGSDRSIFARVLGLSNITASTMATASNLTGAAIGFSMLALDPTACQAAKFAGNGSVVVGGNIQVNSNATCSQGAFNATGNTTVTVNAPSGTIGVVGASRCQGSAVCTPAPSTAPVVPDPLASLPAPAVPTMPAAVTQIAGAAQPVPAGCPGSSTPATATAPATCGFTSSYAGTTWLLSPGYYPGGLNFQAGNFFLRPGIYYIGGGGFNQNGNGANVYSVSATWSATTPPTSCNTSNPPSSFADCGGIMIYNTNAASATSGGSSVRDIQSISLNGGASVARLYPIQNTPPYTGIVIFVDRNLAVGGSTGDVSLNGNLANLTVAGAIYVPNGQVKVNGTGDLGPAQIIARTFDVTGSGTLSVGYNAALGPQLKAVGLVE